MKPRSVIVYVEGPSDQFAMEELLARLLDQLLTSGVRVKFVPLEGKKPLMVKVPQKAVNILPYQPDSIVVALPDLYPPNVGGEHRTVAELREVLRAEFLRWLARKGIEDRRIASRFKVFCFKHDLEALLLAAKPQLAERLGRESIPCTWITPVEDQNHHQPPKRVVEQLFQEHEERYRDTIDAPLILGAVNYPDIVRACPECFGPFVDFLHSLQS
ncbi:MAG: DUF4276 family protein [Anaerolineales bacterium]